MAYGKYIKELLRPLGLYALDEGYGAMELDAIGAKLDELSAGADALERESLLATAEDWGLESWEALFPYRPLSSDAESRRSSVAALMRIDGRSFTLAALNDTVKGCGCNAAVAEGEGRKILVHFPDIMGVPENFPLASRQIESILPCHLEIEYIFRYPRFADLDAAALTWAQLDALALTWAELERTDLGKR